MTKTASKSALKTNGAANAYDFTFKKSLFNDLFWELYECEVPYVINYGSGGSGKSYATAQNELIKGLERKEKILIVRKTANTLIDSVMALMCTTLIGGYSLTPFFTLNKSERILTNKVNGTQYLFRGLDDPEKIKSIEGITRVWIEEASELSEDDFNKLSDRIRGNPQITLTYNPIIQSHWLKRRFHDTPNERVKVFHTTYLDNLAHIGQKFIDDMEWYKIHDYEHYRVYGLGEWGKVNVERQFAFKFEQPKHVGDCAEIDPMLEVYLSFDFNVEPVTCIAAQMGDDFIKVVREFRLMDSDIYALCDAIKAELGTHHIYFVTGDASGSARDALVRGNVNYYTVIENELGLTSQQIQVPRQNPSIHNSRVLLNAILARYPEFVIDRKCVYLVEDLNFVEADDKGGMDKGKDKHRSHLLDCLRYLLNTWKYDFLEQR